MKIESKQALELSAEAPENPTKMYGDFWGLHARLKPNGDILHIGYRQGWRRSDEGITWSDVEHKLPDNLRGLKILREFIDRVIMEAKNLQGIKER